MGLGISVGFLAQMNAEAKRIYDEAAEDGPSWHELGCFIPERPGGARGPELTAWLTLHEMAWISIKHRTAIHFH
jgi:hypothetical protein